MSTNVYICCKEHKEYYDTNTRRYMAAQLQDLCNNALTFEMVADMHMYVSECFWYWMDRHKDCEKIVLDEYHLDGYVNEEDKE